MKCSLPLRLAALPALAAAVVVLVSALSLLEIGARAKTPEPEDPEALQILARPRKAGLVPRTRALPELSEAESLRLLAEAPGRAAAQRLWPLEQHRARLLQVLLERRTPSDLRLFLLGRFAEASPASALEAARTIARDLEVPPGLLLLAAYEVLEREGSEDDLLLLTPRPGEPHQVKGARESYRAALHDRVHAEN